MPLARRMLDLAERMCARAGLPVLERRARDITLACAERPAIVLAPHPDDETLGCGAAILRKLDAGSRVAVVLATDGRHSHHSARLSPDELVGKRAAEFREACARLGVPEHDLHLLRHEDGTLAERADALTDEIAALIERYDPGELLVPARIDGHADHRALHDAALAAAHTTGFAGHVLAYPVWFWTIKAHLRGRRPGPIAAPLAFAALLASPLRSRPLSVSTDGLLDRKRHAIDAYTSQFRAPPDEPWWAVIPEHVLARFLRSRELYFPVGVSP